MNRESAAAKADRITAAEPKRMRWTAGDLVVRRKSDPGKLRLAARLRNESVLSVRQMATRLRPGSYHTANANLHAWIRQASKRKAK